MMVSSDGGFELNGVSFGGSGQGLLRSTGGGINFNNQYGKKVTLNLQYFYGQTNSDFSNLNKQQRFFKDTILSTLSNSTIENVNMNHRIGGTVTWKIDSLTTLTFRPGVTLGSNRNYSAGTSALQENYRGKINSSNNTSRGSGSSNNYSYNLFLNKNFRKKGRTFSVNADFYTLNSSNDNYTDGSYTVYGSGIPEDSIVNQLRQTGGDNLRSTTGLSFAEPLSKKFTLRISHNIQYMKQDNDIGFFSRDNISGKYDQYNQDFSNTIKRSGWKNTSNLSLNFRSKKLSINPGLNYLTASYQNDFSKNPSIKQDFRYIYPSLNVNYGPLSIYYQGNIEEPQVSDLQQVIDISNRFYKRFGNPDLKPSFSQSLVLYVNKYNAKSGNSYSGNLRGNFTNDFVIRETTIDPDGIQTTRPVNVDGIYSFYSSFFYNYQYKLNKDYRLSIRPGFYSNYNRAIISVNGNSSGQNNFNVTPSLTFNINYKDKIELNQRYNQSYRQSTYENNIDYKNIYVHTHSIESEVVIRMPRHVVWENLVNYIYNPQVAQGIRKSTVRWNAGVTYLFLKDDKGQLKLSVYDLLNQNINVYRYISENYISDTQNTTLTRYFMLTFTYNLRNFTGGKVGGKDRSLFFF